ncbi:pyridoxal phosphate-dependent transferase [Gorgonomyces haynaldii]|nr:pyridoxal phosphate-dependent transferase [Gorgonomyces haynaldii]
MLALLFNSRAAEGVKTLLYLLFLRKCAVLCYRFLRINGLSSPVVFYKYLAQVQRVITFTRAFIPGADALVKKEIQKTIKDVQKGVIQNTGTESHLQLPEKGWSQDRVRKELQTLSQVGHIKWETGKVSGTVYHGGKELSHLLTEAFGLFAVSNPLHPDVFPGVRKMESEIVSMVLKMYNAPSDAGGSVTSGGSESILMSIKTHRDYYRTKGITEPEMILPVSAHAAFDKGAQYFGVKIVHIPVNDDGCVNIQKVKSAINSNTILLVGSTPSFPHGAIDDIPALAALAKKHKIGLHVDSCLGGFLVPFMEKAGYPLPFKTDFRLDGVTAISCDTHKYGFAPKGSSVIMYRSKQLRKFQYFLQTEWPGGVYGSPTMAGSRPGALSAGCWAAMMHMGESGYVQSTREIIGACRFLKQGIQEIPQIKVVGEPHLSVIAFQGVDVKTYALADLLSRKKWLLNVLQFPPAIHVACTIPTVKAAQQLLDDIKEAVQVLVKDPNAGNGELAAIYGTAASVPDRNIIADVTCGFLDALTMPETKNEE